MTRWNAVGSGGSNISINVSSGLPAFSNNATKATNFRDDFLLPLAGYRNYDSTATVYTQGRHANYWSSSPDSTNARYLSLDPSYVNAYNGSSRASGCSVRCFKN
jgi:uncharacterized protein (TIGR02145 family)